MRLVVEFSPTDGLEEGLSTVEGLILLHLLSGVDGDVIVVRSLRTVIVCKIMAQPHSPMQRWHEG
jgi:hypothetical protein